MVVTFNDFTTPFNPKALGSWLDSADESDTVRRLKQGAGCRVQGAGCRVQGAGCRVQVAECRVHGAECRVLAGLGRRKRTRAQVQYKP